MNVTRTAVVVVVLAAVATPVLAHVPAFPEDNTSPERALVVPDAAKSWSFYDRLEGGQVKYYRVRLDEGDRLRFGTFTPSRGEFAPSVVLMSESIDGSDRVPAGVEVPEGMGVEVVRGERPDSASYEVFAPSANYHTVDVDRTVDEGGVYLLAVYDPANRSGPAGVTVGHEEEFSPVEYATVPFALVRIHLWAGQHPFVVAAPWLATLVAGVALVASRRPGTPDRRVLRYGVGGGGLLVLGTAASTLFQTGIALAATGPTAGVAVTAVFVAVPAGCGGWALRFALREDPALPPRTRAALAGAAVASLATWAGFLLGPALLFGAAVAPTAPLDGRFPGVGR